MSMRRILMAMLVGCVCAGFVFAAPEPTTEGTKGQITGKIVGKEGSKITVEGQDGRLALMPYWRGGMPEDGGGFDKEMVKKLEQFKVGDTVTVTWTLEEHYRIDTIEKVGPPTE